MVVDRARLLVPERYSHLSFVARHSRLECRDPLIRGSALWNHKEQRSTTSSLATRTQIRNRYIELAGRLHGYRLPAPWWRFPWPPKLSVFVDENEAKGVLLEEGLREELNNSATLLVACSPSARASNYVSTPNRKSSEEVGPSPISFPSWWPGCRTTKPDARANPKARHSLTSS